MMGSGGEQGGKDRARGGVYRHRGGIAGDGAGGEVMSELKVYEDSGGPAFPFSTHPDHEGESHTFFGMSLRDYFAAKAMPIAATFYDTSEEVADEAAVWCYRMADAMLKASQS